ncbi:MAG: ATP-binding protein [Verrucomicrobiota bacterium]
MKAAFLGKIMDRVDKLGSEELQTLFIELSREKGFLETIFNTLHEGVVVLDCDGRIGYYNRSAARLLSLPDKATMAVGDKISKYVKEVDWLKLLTARQTASRDLEIAYPEVRTLQFYLLPLEDEGEVQVAIFHDVTKEQKETRETIESERARAITLLAAGVAHELGNPLNNLNIHLQLMARDLKKLPDHMAERCLQSLDIAYREIDRLDTIINQFLRAVRPTVPEMELKDIVSLLDETLELLKAELEDRKILVEREVEQGLPRLSVDSEQLKQAFYNIIKNAIQAMGDTGVLMVKMLQDDEHVMVRFTDSGDGISSENLPHVREAYFTTKKRGTGLGLMIVHRIVQEHGGLLDIESDKGKGTTITIKLPLLEKRVRLLQAGDSA